MSVTCAKDFDSVEVIMSVEDCFGISLPDKDAERIMLKTVGDLYCYVREHVSGSTSSECLTAKAFYRLRRSLMNLTGRSRSSIRPDTSLDDLLPRANRQRQWLDLQRDLGLELPRLKRPASVLTLTVVATSLMCLVATVFVFLVGAGVFPKRIADFLILAIPLSAIIDVLVFMLTRPLAVHVPGCATVGDLSKCIWAKHFKLLPQQGASDQQIWEAIVNIISESAGIESSLVTRDLRFLAI